MKIELKNCRFDGGNGSAGLAVIEAYILTKRSGEERKPCRSRIGKRHNYKFNFKNR